MSHNNYNCQAWYDSKGQIHYNTYYSQLNNNNTSNNQNSGDFEIKNTTYYNAKISQTERVITPVFDEVLQEKFARYRQDHY